MIRRTFLFLIVTYLCTFQLANAQEYLSIMEEGKTFYANGEYYEAYRRFNAANKISEFAKNQSNQQESLAWLDKAVLGIQQQQIETDSLVKASQQIIDAFYFYDDRLALAYKKNKFGFIDKKGEVVINHIYEKATNFDPNTGYARVTKKFIDLTFAEDSEDKIEEYWLSPEGETYPVSLPIEDLPKIERKNPQPTQLELFEKKCLNKSHYDIDLSLTYHQELVDGIDLFNQGKYYDAYRRFKGATLQATFKEDEKTIALGTMLKDTSIFEMRQLIVRAEEALFVSNKVLGAYYFYDNKYALAFKAGQFYFINNKGEAVEHLGRWDAATNFRYEGLTNVEKSGNVYLLDTLGEAYLKANSLEELTPDTRALEIKIYPLTPFPVEIFQFSNLEIISISTRLKTHPRVELSKFIKAFPRLKRLALYGFYFDDIPSEIGQLHRLEFLGFYGSGVVDLPPEIGQLQKLQLMSFYDIDIMELPPEIGQLKKLKHLTLEGLKSSSLPQSITQLKEIHTLNVSGSGIITLPDGLHQLKKLQTLNLVGSKLQYLPMEIKEWSSMERLDIRGTPLDDVLIKLQEGNPNVKIPTYVNWKSGTYPEIEANITLKKILLNIQKGKHKTIFSGHQTLDTASTTAIYLSNFLALVPEKNKVARMIAANYHELQQYGKSYTYAQKAVNLPEADFEDWAYLSYSALFINKPAEAISAAQKALAMNPACVQTEANLAIAYLMQEDWEKTKAICYKWKGEHEADNLYDCDLYFINLITSVQSAGITIPQLENMMALYNLPLLVADPNQLEVNKNNWQSIFKDRVSLIKDNLYADIGEISNAEYRAFSNWIGKVYGYESNQYYTVLPDTLVWFDGLNYDDPFNEGYFRHPIYDEHPVVGITLQQAQAFSKWRTDRTAEEILVKKKFIKEIITPTPDKHFTIGRYQKGGYDWIIKQEVIVLPYYKIPSITEWELIAGSGTAYYKGIDLNATSNRKVLSKSEKANKGLYHHFTKKGGQLIFNNRRYHDYVNTIYTNDYGWKVYGLPSYKKSWVENIYGLVNVFGNVAEMVEEEGVCKGGSWKQYEEEIDFDTDLTIDRPNNWTGFRNVCYLVKIVPFD